MSASSLPQNSLGLSLADVARITGGRLSGDAAEIVGVTTDSRDDLRGKLFVALVGERFDGHDFALQAKERGARGLLVQRDVAAALPTVRVDSTLAALGALGAQRRRAWGGKLVAVAGSAGKTTTRAALSAVLEAAEPSNVHFVGGNFNNLIGVPLVLLSLGERQRLAVVELGTNQKGEIETLTRLAAPDVAVLTLIGYEHSEGLGDLDGIETEEGALFQNLGPGAIAVGNIDDARVARQLAKAPGSRIGYGRHAAADYQLQVLESSEHGCHLEVGRTLLGRRVQTRFHTSALGEAGAYAACAALAAAEALLGRELAGSTLDSALATPTASEAGRLRPIELTGGILLLDDTYNANPESVESSLRTARQLADRRKARLVLVLGEMRELGELSRALHQRVGEAAAAQAPDLLVAVAGDARFFCEAAATRGVAHEFAADAESAAELLLPRLTEPAVLLVKASRGVRAEKIVDRLVAAKGRAA